MSREDREDREEDSRLFAFAIFAVFARHHSGGKLRRVNRREARPPSLWKERENAPATLPSL